MILNHKSYLQDMKRLARAFAGKPVLNYIGILAGFLASRLTGRVYTAKMPFAFSAEVSSTCNLKCPGCLVGTGKTNRKKPFMDIAVFNKLTDEAYRKSFYVNLYFQGEPFLNKQLFDFIRKAKQKKYYTVVSTNGQFLNNQNNLKVLESKLDKLIVSLDGLSEESYNRYRQNGEFNKVISGIKNLSKQRKSLKSNHPYIVLQFLVHRNNEHEIKNIKHFAKELGADALKLKSMQFYDPGTIERLSPKLERYRRYQQDSTGVWQVKRKKTKLCFRLWSQVVITSDGDVVPCCYDKTPQYVTGNINDITLSEMWKGDKLNHFRRNLLEKKDLPEFCMNCYH